MRRATHLILAAAECVQFEGGINLFISCAVIDSFQKIRKILFFLLSFCLFFKTQEATIQVIGNQTILSTATQTHNQSLKMTGDVTTGNHNLSLKLTIRLSSSTRFDIGSCGSITPSSTIQHVKTIISQREESDNCAVERQRLIYKGRILSDNARTLADYGIGAGDNSSGGADGIIIYLVKGSAANTGAAGGAGGATSAINSAPAPATNAAPTQPNPMTSNPFLNFGAPPATGGNNAANPMANLMNSMGGMGAGGGMPDMATFQQEMMNNPQMMQEMMNNPMVSCDLCSSRLQFLMFVSCTNTYSLIYHIFTGSINHEQSRLHALHDGKQSPNETSTRNQSRITTCIGRSRINASIHGNDERSKCDAKYDEESRFGNESD